MGFLWFGKNVDTWEDVASEKDLKAEATKLEVEWDINLTKKEQTQRLYENYRVEARKEGVTQSRKERAINEMSQQLKRQDRLDEEINLIRTNLETVRSVLSLKNAVLRDKALSTAFGDMDADKLEDTVTKVTQARKEQRDGLEDIRIIVKSASSPITIAAQKDPHYLAAERDVEGPASP